jgi:hypothetical protein
LSTGLSFFQPALALKLIPAGDPHPLRVRMVSWQNGTEDHPKPVITGSVDGEAVERVWVERSISGRIGDVVRGQWVQVGRSLWKTPYVFSLDQEKLPKGKWLLRIAAVNNWGEKAASSPFQVEATPLHGKQ